MKDLRPILWLTLLSALGVLGFALKSRASVVVNFDIPVNGTVFNPCNGENVAFTGVDHFTASTTSSRNGGFHLDTHDNVHVTAIGDEGNTYVGNEEDSLHLNVSLSGSTGEENVPLTFSEISQGSAPNFEMHALLHITINADGTVTVSFSHFTAACRG